MLINKIGIYYFSELKFVWVSKVFVKKGLVIRWGRYLLGLGLRFYVFIEELKFKMLSIRGEM